MEQRFLRVSAQADMTGGEICRISLARRSGEKKTVQNTSFLLTGKLHIVFLNNMNAIKTRWCWRKDLREFRGLSDSDRTGFLLVLEWFEN
jgi:hypothetical protein